MQAIELEISDARCVDVIGDAHSRHWLDTYVVDWRPRECTLRLAPMKGNRDVEWIERTIGAPAIAEAIGDMLRSKHHKGPAARVLAGEDDGIDRDLVLQYAVFGRVKYE